MVIFKMAEKKSRAKRVTNAEKCDIADIICNDTLSSDTEEVILVKLRSKAISNKEKAALYKIVCDRLIQRGYDSRNNKSVKRLWNILFSDYIKAKDILLTKSGVKAMKNTPWVITIADGIKRCNIETDLDDMVLDSQDLANVTVRLVSTSLFINIKV